MKKVVLALLLGCIYAVSFSQQHERSNTYSWPADQLVMRKLHHWQDIKFGLMMHWGTYSQWGVVESWSICPEDEGWTQRKGPYSKNYHDYVQAYENLQTTFNPTDFNPDKWAKAAKYAGMKYVVFTTKHHDGFSMFDTHQSDYKITSKKTPFSSNPKSNITKEIFNSFRDRGFMIGAYFSKPDWHCPFYWWPYFPPKDRNVNYDPAKYPKRWQKFKTYTFNQLQELMTGYGKVDILWLDGGWVRPHKQDKETKSKVLNQDIDMPRIAKMARKNQPGLLIVDRTVAGKFENYQTPEQTVPEKPLDHPWESCITMGNSWSYVPGDHYKSANQLVHLLIKIVSRGGNLLLNIGPSPKGDWSDTAYSRLKEIGNWMQTGSKAIYNSEPISPYADQNLVFTKSKDGKEKYVFILSSDKEDQLLLPTSITLPDGFLSEDSKVRLAGASSVKLKVKGNTLLFPKTANNKPIKYAALLIIENK